MKNLKMIFGIAIVPFFIFCLGCGNDSVAENKSGADSLVDTAKKQGIEDNASMQQSDSMALDTQHVSTSPEDKNRKINVVDANGKRQGFWRITGAMAKDPAYQPDAIVESGHYVDGEKDGLWTTFNPDGSVKKTISIKLRGK